MKRMHKKKKRITPASDLEPPVSTASEKVIHPPVENARAKIKEVKLTHLC